MTSGGRWKLLAGCFLVAVTWQYFYDKYLVVPYLNVVHEPWLQSVHWWMPDVLSLRILGAFGLPIAFAKYHGDTPLVFASMAIEALIWVSVFYALALAVMTLMKARRTVAAA